MGKEASAFVISVGKPPLFLVCTSTHLERPFPLGVNVAVTPSYDLLKGGVTLEIEEGHIKRLIHPFPILHWEDYSRGGGNLQKLGVMLSYPYVSLS